MASKNQKGVVHLAPLLIIFILLGLGIFWLVKNNKLPKPEIAPVSKPTPSVGDNWLTYTNDKFSYQIKYHPDWKAQGPNEPPYPPPPAGMSFGRRWEDTGEWCDFGILASEFEDDFSGEIENIRSRGDEQESSTKLDGVDAIQFTARAGASTVKSLYLTKGGKAYRIGYNFRHDGPNEEACQDVLEKMLGSFEFTSP